MLTTAEEKNVKPGVLYKGYCIDLLNKLQEELGFQYKIHLVKDGLYGSKNKTTGEWNGMMGELIGGVSSLQLLLVTFLVDSLLATTATTLHCHHFLLLESQ